MFVGYVVGGEAPAEAVARAASAHPLVESVVGVPSSPVHAGPTFLMPFTMNAFQPSLYSDDGLQRCPEAVKVYASPLLLTAMHCMLVAQEIEATPSPVLPAFPESFKLAPFDHPRPVRIKELPERSTTTQKTGVAHDTYAGPFVPSGSISPFPQDEPI